MVKPELKQRWKYQYTSGMYYIVEIISISLVEDIIRCRVMQQHSYLHWIGEEYNSAGLRRIYQGKVDDKWIYLQGQEAL